MSPLILKFNPDVLLGCKHDTLVLLLILGQVLLAKLRIRVHLFCFEYLGVSTFRLVHLPIVVLIVHCPIL